MQRYRMDDKRFDRYQELNQKYGGKGGCSNRDYLNPQKEMVEQQSQMAYERAGISRAVLVQEGDPLSANHLRRQLRFYIERHAQRHCHFAQKIHADLTDLS